MAYIFFLTFKLLKLNEHAEWWCLWSVLEGRFLVFGVFGHTQISTGGQVLFFLNFSSWGAGGNKIRVLFCLTCVHWRTQVDAELEQIIAFEECDWVQTLELNALWLGTFVEGNHFRGSREPRLPPVDHPLRWFSHGKACHWFVLQTEDSFYLNELPEWKHLNRDFSETWASHEAKGNGVFWVVFKSVGVATTTKFAPHLFAHVFCLHWKTRTHTHTQTHTQTHTHTHTHTDTHPQQTLTHRHSHTYTYTRTHGTNLAPIASQCETGWNGQWTMPQLGRTPTNIWVILWKSSQTERWVLLGRNVRRTPGNARQHLRTALQKRLFCHQTFPFKQLTAKTPAFYH